MAQHNVRWKNMVCEAGDPEFEKNMRSRPHRLVLELGHTADIYVYKMVDFPYFVRGKSQLVAQGSRGLLSVSYKLL
jgi:hypothetical protein